MALSAKYQTKTGSGLSNRPHDALNLPKSLDGGLMLRLATVEDSDELAAFNKSIHEHGNDPADSLALWTRDLTSGTHPTTSAADFVVAEDTASHKIVSATCLIPQTWAYDGIPFGVGRPELVGTDPAYRRRGLTRIIFEQIHALSAAYGHLVQGITGIPWFYRQFGYEYALRLGGGSPLNAARIPKLKKDEAEPYQVRPATEADIPTLSRLYHRLFEDYMLTSVIDEAGWRYDLNGRSPGSIQELKTYCLLDKQGEVIGYYITPSFLWGTRISLLEIMIEPSVSWWDVAPTVTRALQQQGQAMVDEKEDQTFEGIYVALNPAHPLYEVLKRGMGPENPPYAWYIRVPDLPAFLRHITPALEKRLAESVVSGFSSQVNLSFYRDGLHLTFKDGRLTDASDWLKPDTDEQNRPGAAFPPLVFLQLLFGHRSLQELRYAYPDCWANEEITLLLDALFPKQPSWVQGLN